MPLPVLPLLRATRPRQWVKNLSVAAPLVFAKSLRDEERAWRAAAAVAIFCVISSAVYLWNDVVDVEKDRAHPTKRLRPIAAGTLPIQTAQVFAAAFAALGLSLAWLLDHPFAGAAAFYLALNIAYSLSLKHVPYLDVVVIASGFLLRVCAGALAIDVHASNWLLVCTGLGACFLGFGKRTHELSTAGTQARRVLAGYHPDRLRGALYATGIATVVAYLLYTLAEHTRDYFHTDRMVFTVPLIAVGVVRFLQLSVGRDRPDSPTDEMLKDPLFLANVGAWVIAVVGIIYFAH